MSQTLAQLDAEAEVMGKAWDRAVAKGDEDAADVALESLRKVDAERGPMRRERTDIPGVDLDGNPVLILSLDRWRA